MKKNWNIKNAGLFAALALGIAMLSIMHNASAAVYIPGVTIETVTSEQSPGRPAVDTINDTDFNSANGTLTTDWIMGWMSQGTDYAPKITYDLGAVYNLTSVDLWNWNLSSNTVQGAKDIGISWAGEDLVFTALSPIVLAQAPGTFPYSGQSFSVSVSGARYVQLSVTSSYLVDSFFDRGGGNFNNEVAIAKVRFETVPEPASLALVGIGGLLMFLRMRKSEKSSSV
jgi:hypothetical protein